MVTIQRHSNDPYRVSYSTAPLGDVAVHARPMPPEMYTHGDVTETFLEYARPLVGPLDPFFDLNSVLGAEVKRHSMNTTDEKYTRFALCREMMETMEVVRDFDLEGATAVGLVSDMILFSGEGSSRIFPANRRSPLHCGAAVLRTL
jgi:hypothetical protein